VPILIAAVIVLFFLFSAIKVIPEWERGVVLRWGRLRPKPKGPGLIVILPLVDTLYRITLQEAALDVPPQDIITRDNVTATVTAVVYHQVVDPQRALVAVQNYRFAASQFALTTLRSVCGEVELDDLLSSREKLVVRLREILDQHTEPWGVKVTKVEIKAVDLPENMQRAIARQAEAEREKRAKIIHAEGEFSASQRLTQASAVMATEPIAIQLRYLQTLAEIGTEKNTTVIFPLPIEFFQAFLKQYGPESGATGGKS
jgi:regulator of protease activity HflC (stomatin/prohibitin superfamily)